MESKKNDTNKLIYKTEIDSQTENKLMITKGEKGKIYPTECRVPENNKER